MKNDKPITAVIVGAGHRSLLYGSYALEHPDQFKIVGVVDPNPVRRDQACEMFSIPQENIFASIDELLERPLIADAVINGTMDSLHVPLTIPLLEKGYNVLLEKPIGISKEEVLSLWRTAQETGKLVMICHVLRYAPFYVEIKKAVAEGKIGKIVHIETTENVSYHHIATAFIRGKWNSKAKCGSSFLMAKCCHDLDIISWLKSGVAPTSVASFGHLTQFKKENAPEGAGTRCLTDCKIEDSCPYSAKRLYIDKGLWRFYAWESIEHLGGNNASADVKIESLKTDNPYGRCVWHCDNDIVDHQSVIIQFEDGCIATHNLIGATARPCRAIHIVGTQGEIEGVMEDGQFVIRHPYLEVGKEHAEEIVRINAQSEMHGGGDLRLVEDFVRRLRGEDPSISSTVLEDSIYGHLIGFAADQSMDEKRNIDIEI